MVPLQELIYSFELSKTEIQRITEVATDAQAIKDFLRETDG